MSAWLERKRTEIHQIAAAISGLQHRLVTLVGEVDEAEAWRADGQRSVEGWLKAELSVDWHSAHCLVEVGEALVDLPEIAASFERGELSFEQTRALCQFATPDEDSELAGSSVDESVDRLRRKARERMRVSDEETKTLQERRWLRHWTDRSGILRLDDGLAPGDGAVVVTTLERLVAQAAEDPDALGNCPSDQRNADALVRLASMALGADSDPDRATVVVHVDAEHLVDGVGLTDLGLALPNPSLRRLSCDGRIETVEHDECGVVVGIDRASRRIPAWLSRALKHSDQGCRFPGCETRLWVHGHHIIHWADGGRTDLDNLITLCGFHHTSVHEHGWRLSGDPNRDVTWIRPNGRPYTPGRGALFDTIMEAQRLLRDFKESARAP